MCINREYCIFVTKNFQLCDEKISYCLWLGYGLAKVTVHHDKDKVQLPKTSYYNY